MVETESMDFGVFEDGLLDEIDWDDFQLLSNDEISNPSPPLSIGDIEQFLMDDDNEEEQDPSINDPINAFLADIILDSPVQSSEGDSSGSDRKLDNVSRIDTVREKEEEEEEEENDPLAKKRKRQLRNRDAAVKSRERKKEYVRDLEMKSKYFEAECRRLGMVLQCCVAENHALRLSLQNTVAVDASTTKQESAVLVMESLLLGSLLWFLGIICLLILPSQLHATPKEIPLGNGGSGSQLDLFPRKRSSEILRNRIHGSFMMGKSCKASRSRMKLEAKEQVIRCIS